MKYHPSMFLLHVAELGQCNITPAYVHHFVVGVGLTEFGQPANLPQLRSHGGICGHWVSEPNLVQSPAELSQPTNYRL